MVGLGRSGWLALAVCGLATTGCLPYRGAPELLSAKTLVRDNKAPDAKTSNNFPMEMQVVYDLMTTQADYAGRTSIVLQLMAVSDRVCHNYVSDFLDVRDGINFGVEASKQLTSVFSAFAVGGSTITRFNAITGGIGIGLNNYYVTNALFGDKLQQIVGKRKIYRNFIVNAWQENQNKTPSEITTEPYSVLMFLLDIDRYHQLCGFYDVLYLNPPSPNINDDVKELFAYKHQPKDTPKDETKAEAAVAKTLGIN